MAWITVNYRPGFAYDLTSWHTEIEFDGQLTQTVTVARFSPIERRTVRHKTHLTVGQVSVLSELIAAVDFMAIGTAARHVIDDAEEVAIAIERDGRIQRFSAPLLSWSFSQQRGEFALPELEPAIALWKALDRFSPHGLDHPNI